MEKKDILIIIILFFIAFLIRVPCASNVSIYPDEPDYWTTSNRILANNFVPAYETFCYYPPFFSYIAAAVTLFFEGDLNTLRMISVLAGSLTVSALYLFGKAMYDRKTGLLSALFMCFSAYHSLFSRLIMQEAFTLFFITAFSYFFWLSRNSEQEKGNRRYAILAGVMLGLSFDAKYISIFLVPSIIAYLLWTNNFSFKVLIDKKIILMSIFAFLFSSPLLISWCYTGVGLSPLLFYSVEMFEKRSIVQMNYRPMSQYSSPIDLLSDSISRIVEILAWGSAALSSHWGYIFLISTGSVFFITLIIYFLDFMKKENKSSFLIILIFSLHVLLMGCSASKYRLMYAFPFYFVMFSHITIISINCFKKKKNYTNIFRVFILLLVTIMLFFYFITGISLHSWDKGEYSWSSSAIDYIKNDVTKSNFKGQILIGVHAPISTVDYSIYSNDFNASTIYIFKLKKLNIYSKQEYMTIDLKKINTLKPNYLIVYDKGYQTHFTEKDKKEIFKNYNLVFRPKTIGTIPYTALVFKRKNMQFKELLLQTTGSEEIVSKDILRRSVPKIIKTGRVYIILVQVKNMKDVRTILSVEVYPGDMAAIYVENSRQVITLDANSTRMLRFKIVPFRGHVGGVPINVDVYAKRNENEEYEKVDAVSNSVFIEK